MRKLSLDEIQEVVKGPPRPTDEEIREIIDGRRDRIQAFFDGIGVGDIFAFDENRVLFNIRELDHRIRHEFLGK